METAWFEGQKFTVGKSCPLKVKWAISQAENLPAASFLASKTLRTIAGCPQVRPTLELAGVVFQEERPTEHKEEPAEAPA